MVKTPVLFITFCRPDYARKTWDAIKEAKPSKVYFYSNKGRSNVEGEIDKNNEIRNYINEIDWDCDLHTFFRDECVNVYDSLRGAINWLFENEPEGIVLEEDCVPTLAFFSFVDQMIEEYRNNDKVWIISGDNFAQVNPSATDYIFSHYHWMYGWASWADRWHSIDWENISMFKSSNSPVLKSIYKTIEQTRFRRREIRNFADFAQRTKCWDYYLGVFMDINQYLSVCPKEHLITNIGYAGIHHSKPKKGRANLESQVDYTDYQISIEPANVEPDLEYDYLTYCHMQRPKSLMTRAFNKVLRLLKLKE